MNFTFEREDENLYSIYYQIMQREKERRGGYDK